MQGGEQRAAAPAGGWYRDPWGQAEWRWFDGRTWTPYIATSPRVATDRGWKDRPAVPTLPFWAAVAATVTVAMATVIDRTLVWILQRHAVPLAIRDLVPFIIYGILAAAAVLIVRRARPDLPFAEAIGARFRPADLAWGVVWMIAARVAAAMVGIVIVVGRVPFQQNLPYDPRSGRFRPPVSTLVVLVIIAVFAAPIVEEMLFRGVLLRGLRSRLSTVPAVAVQGVLFGASHASLAYGAGNIGLILMLSAIGVVFGFAAENAGRLGPSMCAHALVNATALAVAWLLLR